MEDDLTWFDKNIVWRTKAYKNFVQGMEKTSPEEFDKDGERIFTDKEKKFLQIYNVKNGSKEIPVDPYSKIEISNREPERIESNINNSFVRDNDTLPDEGSKGQVIGEISFYDFNGEVGEVMKYTSVKSYLNALANEFDSNMGDFKYETVLNDPKLRKDVDDIIYGAYGEKNPKSLDHYLEKEDVIGEKNKYKINDLEKPIKNINNQTPNIMETQKEFDQVQYLKDQMKYLGFGEGEKLHKDLEKGINGKDQQFEIRTESDKTLPGNKVDFTLKFNKTENGGIFLNAYNAKLENGKDESLSHQFYVNKENTFTAKEAVNLLEGRTVKIEFTNPKTEQSEPAFVKLNFDEPKTEKGNYNFQNFYKNYGVDPVQIVEKSNLIFDKPEYKESTIKSLEKGNIVKVKFELDDKVIEGKAVLNPQYKNLSLYDQDMNRINTNKPLEGLEQDNKHEKNNVKEQSIKR